ncbi:sugar phosphate nucleotidyltransferase [Candidatus Omnitrophota bacterium]
MQAVILAGGRGTRLRPLTNRVAKPMAPVNGKPFLCFPVELLRRYGVKDYLFCLGYKWRSIKRYFGDGKRFGVRIRHSVEKRPLGTGGALKNAEGMLHDEFILLNGDTFLPIDYGRLIKRFFKLGKAGIAVVTRNRCSSIIGNMSMNKSGLITVYRKLARRKKLEYLDAGAGIFRKDIVELFPEKRAFSFEERLYPLLIRKRELAGYLSQVPFYDIGTLRSLKNFEERMMR